MKKALIWLLAAAMAVSLMGCINAQVGEQDTTQDEFDITWQKAFRNDDFPAGGMMNDEVAFAITQNGVTVVDNIAISDLIGYDDGGYLPRYSLLELEEPEKLDLTPACIGYALQHNYDRFVLPASTADMRVPTGSDREYWWSMDISCDINKSNFTVQDDGSTFFYCLCVLKTPLWQVDFTEWNREQAAAFDAAKQVVAELPSDCVSDYDKVLYFYRYLTDNVRYAYDEDYPEGEDYYTHAKNLYYDTLIKHKTVCAGYGKTLAWLCELAGLEAFPASGQYGATDAHLWTMVKIDGGYYWFDPTWDAGEYPEQFRYFGISDEEMEERGGVRHLYQAYDELLPDCPESLPLPQVSGLTFGRGTVSGDTYRNEAFGLTCQIPDGWFFLDDTQIEQGDGEALTPFETLLAAKDTAYDMYAVSGGGEELYVQVCRWHEKDADVANILLESFEEAAEVLSSEKSQVSFCGKTCWSAQASLNMDGSTVCLRFIIVPLDDALLLIRSYSDDPERCAQLLDCFTAIGR
ncbi:MAG: hypothetical protein IJG45_04935 [Oscillospiraceae bacterium]|nr:hypothetical protein [Oscillospiraceae bacterium]